MSMTPSKTTGAIRHLGAIGIVVVAMVTTLFARPAEVTAQSGLEQVERLTRMGRTEEARVALVEWWDNDRSNASRRELQRGLWLRGRLTVDPVQAELDFQRLVLLYPSGPFTPDAVLRLAQASWAMGDEAATRRYLDTLERDYRRSEAWERAQTWFADAGPLPPEGDTPTTTEDVARTDPPARSGRNVERPPVERAPAERPADAGAPPTAAVMNYYVQLGAFADQERAMALYDEVRARNVDARVVRVDGSQFTHVRVGRFAERAAAVELLEELTARGISAALVRDDREERPAGN